MGYLVMRYRMLNLYITGFNRLTTASHQHIIIVWWPMRNEMVILAQILLAKCPYHAKIPKMPLIHGLGEFKD